MEFTFEILREAGIRMPRAIGPAISNFKSDIFGFGEVIHRKYPKVWEKIKDD